MSSEGSILATGLDQQDLDLITAVRRDIHAHPEIGYQEHRTRSVIERELGELGVAFRGGVAETGVVAYLPATEPTDRTVALRADIDALPIEELTNLPYASGTANRMHACGHDGHTAILLGTARALSRLPRPNNVLLLFQPAEEGGAGGKKMVDEGVLDGAFFDAKPNIIFGLHGYPTLQVGQISTRTGPLMASAASLRITIRGKGAHAAYPHHGIDPILVAAHLITALQSVASRNVDPLDSVVVTIGKVISGVAHNVIPETATLDGTLRTLNQETERIARERIEAIVASLPAAFGAEAEIAWGENPYPVTFNDPDATDHLRGVLRQKLGAEQVREERNPSMGGEDFSYYGYRIPACFFFLGLKNSPDHVIPNLHSPFFDFNDAAIPVGIGAMTALAQS
jgi:amidohydrolase